jgi:hypothetical protein
MKKTETREQTLERLSRDSYKGAKANKRFTSLVRKVAKTPTPAAASAKELSRK